MFPALLQPSHQIQGIKKEPELLMKSFPSLTTQLFLLELLEERNPGHSEKANMVLLGALV